MKLVGAGDLKYFEALKMSEYLRVGISLVFYLVERFIWVLGNVVCFIVIKVVVFEIC